jgi:ribosomal protein S18 acetylase RimI-like enzyme
MEIRAASPTDLDLLWPLAAGFRDTLRRNIPDSETLKVSLRRLLASGEAEFFLAIDDTGKAIGYVQQRYRYSIWMSGLEATLEDLFVSADSRGLGVGAELVRFAIRRAEAKGCESIKLDTNESNTEAIHLYERLGFSSGSTRFSDSRQVSFERALNSSV